jgi:hypothetical protein
MLRVTSETTVKNCFISFTSSKRVKIAIINDDDSIIYNFNNFNSITIKRLAIN